MHLSGPLPLTFERPEHGFWGKNCQNGSWGKLENYMYKEVPIHLNTPLTTGSRNKIIIDLQEQGMCIVIMLLFSSIV